MICASVTVSNDIVEGIGTPETIHFSHYQMEDFDGYALEEEAPEEDEEGPKNENSSIRSGSATPIERTEKDKDKERVKLPVKYIENKTRRHVTFSKRRLGIMKKAYELSVLTGANILLLILSRTGLVYTFTTPKLEPIVRDDEGKNLIRACLNAASMEPTPTTQNSSTSTPTARQHTGMPTQM